MLNIVTNLLGRGIKPGPPRIQVGRKRVLIAMRRDIAGAARIAVLVPRAADACVLVVDAQVDVAQPLRDPDAQVHAREAGANDADLQWAVVLDGHLREGEWLGCRAHFALLLWRG